MHCMQFRQKFMTIHNSKDCIPWWSTVTPWMSQRNKIRRQWASTTISKGSSPSRTMFSRSSSGSFGSWSCNLLNLIEQKSTRCWATPFGDIDLCSGHICGCFGGGVGTIVVHNTQHSCDLILIFVIDVDYPVHSLIHFSGGTKMESHFWSLSLWCQFRSFIGWISGRGCVSISLKKWNEL